METAQLHTLTLKQSLTGKVTEKGFKDVSLLTGGMEAAGHGLWLDEGSVSTCVEALMGRSIPAYLTHEGASTDRLGKEIAVASGAYRDGQHVRASQLNFLDSFGRHQTETRDRLVELASDHPDQLGVSLVLSFEKSWILPDGSEVNGDGPKPETAIRDIPSIRVRDVRSADLVSRPAANVGLFSKKDAVDQKAKDMATEISLSEKHTAELATISATHTATLEKLAKDHEAALMAKDLELGKQLIAKDVAHKAALEAKDKVIADAKVASDAALAAKDVELAAAKVFDARQLGLSESIITAGKLGKTTGSEELPEPAKTDAEKWEQHAKLAEKSPKLALAFKEKHLSGVMKSAVRFTPAG